MTWRRRVSRIVVALAAAGVVTTALAPSALAASVAAIVNATPSSNVWDGTTLAVSGTAPRGVKTIVLIDCDGTQMAMVGQPYDANHCDTSPSDQATLPVTNNAFSGSFVFHDPLSTQGAGTVGCDTGCRLIADNPAPGDVSSASTVTGNSCNGVFQGSPSGSVVKSTSAGPSGSSVTPGEAINVTLTWNRSDFGGSNPDKTDDCVEIGSQASSTLSQEHKPGPAGGTDTFTYTVPASAQSGTQVCDRGRVSGPVAGSEKSAVFCYSVLGSTLPETRFAILLPLAVAVIGGAGFVMARRRRMATRRT